MTLDEYGKLPTETLMRLIAGLKQERQAIFLVHNYQRLEVQRVADYIGDSLALAQAAAQTRAKLIVFCGVHFMAETAKILNPQSKVIMPDTGAGCPMADMVTEAALARAKEEYGQPLVVAYVNTSAAVKAQSHICCTSSNAVRVVASLPRDGRILFVPDRNLGSYAARMAGRDIILWPGYCAVHDRITVADVEQAREAHPGARLIVHPECRPQVVALADEVASTSGMVRAVASRHDVKQWIIGTEIGLVEQLAAAYPDKGIYPLAPRAVCGNMKLTTLDKAAWALEHEAGEITVPEDVAAGARRALERMLALG